MSMSSLAQILLNGNSPDPNVRNPAEQQLRQLETQNFAEYIVELCKELGNEQGNVVARQLAGIMLKNCLVAKDETKRQTLFKRWLALHDNIRNQVKVMVLQILGSSQKNARSTASLVISKIAAVEIPLNKWPDLVQTLVGNATSQDQSKRQASFAALGYVCEECPQHLQNMSNPILNAIAGGLRAEETNDEIKLAATVALANSLEFVKKNFENQQERNLIMQMVFAATQCRSEAKVRVAGYQCLVAMATLYYNYLGPYMQFIFQNTATAIQNDEEEVAQQAIEFWCTISDEEIEINDEIEEAQAKGEQPQRQSSNFMNQALKDIMPLILVCLTKQSEELDDETWNVAKSAALCIGLVAEATMNNIVQHVLPFVQQNIQNGNWRFREAAVLAFGYMLDGPDRKSFARFVQNAFPVLLGHMRDSSDLVRDTTAWTLGRVCDLFAGDVVNQQTLPPLMQALLQGLSDAPSIACNSCWAIHNLASAISLEPGQKSSMMSPYFEGFVTQLIALSNRLDEPKLMSAAFATINILVQSAASDMDKLIAQLLPAMLNRLRNTHQQMPKCNVAQQAVLGEVQAHLCGALQVIVRKVDNPSLAANADQLMRMFLTVLSTPSSTVHEESIHAIGGIANRMGPAFEKYMEAFKNPLLAGLRNAEQQHLCSNSIATLSAVANALQKKLYGPALDEIMSVLLQNLQSPEVDRKVKPQIISCVADIVGAVGPYFQRYFQYVMVMLVQASGFTFQDRDFESLEYLNILRDSILEAYCCILQTMGTTPQGQQLFLPYLDKIHPFLAVISQDQDREDKVLKGAIGLIGDLAQFLNPHAGRLLGTPACSSLLNAGLNSSDPKVRQITNWARQNVNQVLAGNSTVNQ